MTTDFAFLFLVVFLSVVYHICGNKFVSLWGQHGARHQQHVHWTSFEKYQNLLRKNITTLMFSFKNLVYKCCDIFTQQILIYFKLDSLWYPYSQPIKLKIYENCIDLSTAPSYFLHAWTFLFSVVYTCNRTGQVRITIWSLFTVSYVVVIYFLRSLWFEFLLGLTFKCNNI